MSVGEYPYRVDGTTPAVQPIEWRERRLLFVPGSAGGIRVLGICDSCAVPSDEDSGYVDWDYKYGHVPIKEQRGCRRFLRGCSQVYEKIRFDGDSRAQRKRARRC